MYLGNLDFLKLLQDLVLMSAIIGFWAYCMISWSKARDREFWEKCVKKSQIYRVVCSGEDVDVKRVDFAKLNMDDWNVKLDDKNMVLYMKPEKGRNPILYNKVIVPNRVPITAIYESRDLPLVS